MTLTIWWPPQITTQPKSNAVVLGTNIILTVAVDTTKIPTNFTYQWFQNNFPLADDGVSTFGSTTKTLGLTNVQAVDAGQYTVNVSNDADTTTSASATLYVVTPPVFVDQPDSTTAVVGDYVLLSVAVDPATTDDSANGFPLTYKWRKNGAIINDTGDLFGTDTPILQIAPLGTIDAGTYACFVQNYAGSVLSTGAVVTVLVPPYITSPSAPQNLTNAYSSFLLNLPITVDVNSTTPLGYQWYSNQIAVVNATNATYSFIPNNTNQSATYYCIVSNAANFDFSYDFDVLIRPEIIAPVCAISSPSQAQDGQRWSNSVITLSGSASDSASPPYGGVAYVRVQNNGGAWSNATPVTTKWSSWSFTNRLTPGSNVMIAQSTDFSGNSSLIYGPNTRTVFYPVPSPFTLNIVGPGTVSSN